MYNKVIMIGNLTRDIELKYLPSGSAIAKSAIATSHRYKTQTGEQKEEVCFLDFSVFGKGAEILNQYVRKGSKVMLEGRLIFEQWQAADGSNRSRHTLRVEEFKFLDSKNDSMGTNQGGGYNQPAQMPMNDNYGGQSYEAPQARGQYNQPMQQNEGRNFSGNSYQQNNYGSQQQGGMQKQQEVEPYEQNIPTIDIDNDEIPF
jgi:single-strand DNA-binding protein